MADTVGTQDTIVVQYAAKLLCGVSNRPGIAPGRYYTAVNVHNPARDSVFFRYKFVLTRPNAVPGPISPWTPATLRSDQALEIECSDAVIKLGGGFAKGFVVVETQRELDVVGSTRRWRRPAGCRRWRSIACRHDTRYCSPSS